MKIYFDSNFSITKREYEDVYQGSEFHNKLEVYFPKPEYNSYNYIYPVFSVKRADGRVFGEFALPDYEVVDNGNYLKWSTDLPKKALEIEGVVEITISFKYSNDGKYAKVSTGKVLLNVKDAIISENDIIYIGENTNLLTEIDAIRNEFGSRFNDLEMHYIGDYSDLNNFKTTGIYKINFDDTNIFHLFVYGNDNEFIQIRSSANGYYRREYDNGSWTDWIRKDYVLKVEGKGLSTNDLTDELLAKLNALKNYDDTALMAKITTIENILKTDDVDLDTLQEIVDMLKNNADGVDAIFQQLSNKVNKTELNNYYTKEEIDKVISNSSGEDNSIYLGDVDTENYINLPNDLTFDDFKNINRVKLSFNDSFLFGTKVVSTEEEIQYGIEMGANAIMISVFPDNTFTATQIVETCLKNHDNKPDDYFYATYNEITLNGLGGYVRVGEYTSTISHQDSSGYSSVYMGGGNLDIIADKDVKINDKSFNKLYDQVQMISGNYDIIRPSSTIDYARVIDSAVEKYAYISEVGGMSYKSKNLYDKSKEIVNSTTYEGNIQSSTKTNRTDYIKVSSNTSYAFSSNATDGNARYVCWYDSNKTYISQDGIFNPNTSLVAVSPSNASYCVFSYCNEATKVQITKSSSVLDFVDYFDGIRHTKVTDIKHTSANIIKLDDMAQTTKNGGTLKISNGVITLNGTFTAYSEFTITLPQPIIFKKGVSYSINLFPFSTTIGDWGVRLRKDDNTNIISYTRTNYQTSNKVFEEDTICTKVLIYTNVVSYSNYTIKPMLVYGATPPTTFEKYTEKTTISLNEIQSMEGYGLGINESCYNYLDFDKDVLVRKVLKHTFTGNETFGQSNTTKGDYRYWCSTFQNTIKKVDNVNNKGNILMAELDTISANDTNNSIDGIAISNTGTIIVYKSDIQTLDAMKAYLKGKTLYYEVLEPVESALPQIDTFIEAQQGDVITFENEYDYPVPNTIKYIKVV